jgi:DNA topoisomerase-1
MDYKFTADMETQLDEVACGKLKWVKVMDKFYKDFKVIVDKISKSTVEKQYLDREVRELGNHPDSGNRIIATVGIYGPIVKMFTDKEGKKCVIAPVKKPLNLKTVKLKDAIDLFVFPINLGKYKQKAVSLNRGEYGYYLKFI